MKIPSKEEIRNAFDTMKGDVVDTPLIASPALADISGADQVYIKMESFQHTGSFKFRGAYWRCQQLTEEEKKRGIIAYSSGNFAQGLAAAAGRLDIPCKIVMPDDAPQIKQNRTAALGGRVILSETKSGNREEIAEKLARRIAAEEDLTLLHPFDAPYVITGNAATALEVLESLDRSGMKPPTGVLCPAGGGGFVSGLALGFHYFTSGMWVSAVEPEGYDGLGQSLQAGKIVPVGGKNPSLCDALKASKPGALPFECSRFTGIKSSDVVNDNQVSDAMRFAFEKLKIILEPSGAVAIASLLSSGSYYKGERLILFATGGNISADSFCKKTGLNHT
ncbi:MAG: threonine/serine dehydratase [Desulfobacter sp.]